MWLLDWLTRDVPPASPRTYAEIRSDLERREAAHIRRLTRVEESLLALTAEAGLEDLRRRLEDIPRD